MDVAFREMPDRESAGNKADGRVGLDEGRDWKVFSAITESIADCKIFGLGHPAREKKRERVARRARLARELHPRDGTRVHSPVQ